MLKAEGDLLWSTIGSTPNKYDFTHADWLAEYAQTHKMLFGATHLVWHDCLPSWFKDTVNQENAKDIMLNHIKTAVKQFAGKIHLSTVVNEVIDRADGKTDGLRKTPWLELLGPECSWHADPCVLEYRL
jgi:endo-1,4-beta-xylanase